MKQFSTLCTVNRGKLKLFSRVEFDHALAQFCDGQELELHVEEVGRKRTHAQNRFFHGPILSAFMTLGYHKQEAKDMLALHLIPRDVKQLDGTIVKVPGHTSELSVDEFNDLIDACLQLAAEQELIIQDAAEWRARRGAAA